MRIGILTMISNNYGALLQCYALQTVLQSLGHEVIVVNRKWGKLNVSLSIFEKLKCIKNKIQYILKNDPYENFRLRKLMLSKAILTYEDLKKYSSSFDVVIVGSDQVWNDGCHKVMNFDFYLDWVDYPKVKRFSYAASFGKDTFEATDNDVAIIKELLHSFSGISVRENSGLNICTKQFGVKARCDLDPTLLLQASDYIKIMSDYVQCNNKFICCYFLDPNVDKLELVSELSAKLGVGYKDNMPLRKRYNVEEWLSNIYNSNYVITDSFHGMVFSIIFRKQFLCLNNNKRGSARFFNLLNKLNLLDRLINIGDDLSESFEILSHIINYDEVESKLNAYRRLSLDYLKSIDNN